MGTARARTLSRGGCKSGPEGWTDDDTAALRQLIDERAEERTPLADIANEVPLEKHLGDGRVRSRRSSQMGFGT
jgi:hypothetical protein